MLLPRIPGMGMGSQPGHGARDTGTLCVQYPRTPEEGIRPLSELELQTIVS